MRPHFSLILATYGRTEVIARTLDSIKQQSIGDVEVIVVDQNPHDSLAPLLQSYSDHLDIRHLKVDRPGLSNARNVGLAAARGRLVGFPDDDCHLSADLLAHLGEVFERERADFVCVSCRRESDDSLLPYTPLSNPTPVNTRNLFYVVTSIGLFVRRDVCPEFDLRLGLGAPFPSCEEMDLAYRLLKSGHQGIYRPQLVVYHPETRAEEVDKVARHAAGHGAFIRKHLWSSVAFFTAYGVLLLWVKPTVRLAEALIRRDHTGRRFFQALLAGRLRGFREFR